MDTGNKPLQIVFFAQSLDNESADIFEAMDGEVSSSNRSLIVEEINEIKSRGSLFLDGPAARGWILTDGMGIIEFRTIDRDVLGRIAPILVLITIRSDDVAQSLSTTIEELLREFTIKFDRKYPDAVGFAVNRFLDERQKKKRRELVVKVGFFGLVAAIGIGWWWWRKNSFS